MSGRGLRKAVRCGDHAVKSLARPAPRRNFTSTAICQRHGAVPGFTPTSSPELDDILTTFRTKLFLPAHLSLDQRRLIYKRKYEGELSVEPVIAKLGEEEFQLEHLDKTKDIPNARKHLLRAVNLMKDKKDWSNLPHLLEGLRNIKTKLEDLSPITIVRKAAAAGRLDVLLECAQRVGTTGFALQDPELITDFIWRIQDKAQVSGWDAKETAQALTWAERFSYLLADERHAGDRAIAAAIGPNVQPVVTGILLQLSAVRAARHLDGKDEDGKVAQYAGKLLRLPLNDGSMAKAPEFQPEVHAVNYWLASTVPVVHGMKVAQTVLDPVSKVAAELPARTSELENLILQKRDFLLNSGRQTKFRGLTTYNKLLGPESSESQ